MKVAFLHSQCENGGISRIVFSIIRLLEQQGDEGRFFFARGFVPEGKEAVCQMFGTSWDTRAHAILTRLTDAHGLGSRRATRQLLTQLREYKPDIIHLNNVHGYHLNYPLFFRELRKWGIPVVWTFHDCWPFTGHCVHFEDVPCDRWKTGCFRCPQKREYPSSLLLDRSRKNYIAKKAAFSQLENLTIVTPSQWLGGLVRQSFLREYPCRVIPNGIRLDWFQPTPSCLRMQHGLGSQRLVLAVASVWTAKKGYDDIRKLETLLPDCRIVMVGVNPKQCRELARTGILPIPHTKDVQELAQWYSAADVFCNPTYEDTLPTVNIEALACGTPVVTYRAGGSPEILAPDCGTVVEPGDIEALAREVLTIQKDEQACRRRALQYNCDEKFADYVKLYDEILQRKG